MLGARARVPHIFRTRLYSTSRLPRKPDYFTKNSSLGDEYTSLKKELQSLYKSALERINSQMESASMVRKQTSDENLAPPVLGLPADDIVLNENEIWSFFSLLKLDRTQRILTYPAKSLTWAGYSDIEYRRNTLVVPGESDSAVSWNEFVKNLVDYNTRGNQAAQKVKLATLRLVLEIAGNKLTLNTFNRILLSLSWQYELTHMNQIYKHMTKEYDIEPDIQTYNIFIKTIMRSNSRNRVRRCIRILQDMICQDIVPDAYTWNLICGGLKDVHETLNFMRRIYDFNIPLLCQRNLSRSGIQFPVTKELFDPNLQIDYETSYSLMSLGVRVQLQDDKNLRQAFAYMQQICLQSQVQLGPSLALEPKLDILKLFLQFILFEWRNLPYAIAFLQYFEKSYPSLFGNKAKSEIYSMFTSAMSQFEESPLWSSLLRYFYHKSLDEKGNATLNKTDLGRLQEVISRNNSKIESPESELNFVDMTASLTLVERTVIDRVFKQLRWPGSAFGEGPIWDLKRNTPAFQQACNAIGCYKSLDDSGSSKEINLEAEKFDAWQYFDYSKTMQDDLFMDVATASSGNANFK
ncbi:hypothetical protein OGAPHI_002888 [Ogataea philodendri]|uniref:Uncharacterized protein n=1 Tax=Ogataea philodendri TaxID=1378263 RepID=A0A9P8P975_9ASCO|nr:uncharacterized protein OGAPHI_002888 [Ogataea philodendri]KAH3667239.1 hypothetical protein OGAPHI_002888 [Ogataea philodendri]